MNKKSENILGVLEVIFDFCRPLVPKTLENMKHFMKEVVPLVE